jgi:hypothetical protein
VVISFWRQPFLCVMNFGTALSRQSQDSCGTPLTTGHSESCAFKGHCFFAGFLVLAE